MLTAVVGVVFSPRFVCVCFSTQYLKTDAVKITKLHIQMFHGESWKPIYFGVQRSLSRVNKSSVSVGLCTPVSAGFS